jgi:hypothetical protein
MTPARTAGPRLCQTAKALIDPSGPLDIDSFVKERFHYQPITTILYVSRMITVASAIQDVSE